MVTLSNDNIIEICSFLDTRSMLKIFLVSKELYNFILTCKVIMVNKIFTVNKNIKNLSFINKLPYKIYHLNISSN